MNISEIVNQVSKENQQDTPPVDIIQFAEAPWGLNMNRTTGNTILRPVQKMILKCFYNIPLDEKQKTIVVRDFLNEQELYNMTEREYLSYLWNEGRTNLREQTFSLSRNELVLVCGRRGGKCLAKSVPVLTPKGPVPIEELKIGDTVYGYNKDGSVSETKVLNVFEQGEKDVVELINHGRVLATCTDEHRWLCADERNTKTFEHTPSEFNLRHGKKKAQIVRRFVKIPCGDVHEPHAYALGALLGDGCSRQSGNSICISSADDKVPSKVASLLKADGFKKNHESNYNWTIYGERNDRGWFKKLECNHYNNWCHGKYAHEKTVDLEVIKSWDRESCLNFMAGLIDTDGSVYFNDKCLNIHISMQAKPVIEAFKYLFLRLFQYDLTLRVDSRDKYVNGPCYEVKLKNNFFASMALKELDPYLVTPSKKWKPEYEKLLANNSNPDFVGVTLGKRYKAETYDIEVDNETNLYVLANQGLITHNSKLGAIVSAYEAYALIKKPHPQKHFGITDNAEIYISTVATSTDQAQLLFNDIAAYIDHSPYFSRYKNPPTLQYMTLRTLHDIESDTKSASIVIQAAPCSARGLRGMSNMVVIMDEQAHFVDSSANSSDSVIYEAVTPSTLSFGKEAKILNLSSPLNKQGKLWELYNQSFGSEKLLMFQIPTWELYPDIDSSELRERYRRNPDVYWCEIGAKFSDTVKSWMPRDQFMKCVVPDLKPKVRGLPRTAHFMGVDIGLKKDMTAFSVVHIAHVKEPVLDFEGRVIDEIIVPKYELDYQEVMQAGKDQYGHMEFLDFDEIANRIEFICKEFSIQRGLFDQYNGVPLKQALDKKGLNQFEMMYFDRRINSELYNNFMLQAIDGKLRLYDEGGTAENPGEFISEVLDLQSEHVSKYITMVFAPEVEGKHDDRSDSFVRALWCATQWALQKGAMDIVRAPTSHEMAASATLKKQTFGNGYVDRRRSAPLKGKQSPYSVFFNKRR